MYDIKRQVIKLEKFLEKVIDFATHAGIKILISLIVLIVGFKLISFIVKKLKNGKALSHMDPSVRTFMISSINISLKVVLIVTVASYIGVPMTSVITLIGSAGVAIGLALQGGLSNIASGIMILLFRPFSVGDYICVNDYEGNVTSIGIFHTTLLTYDNRRVIIPNSVLTANSLINLTAEKVRRVDIDFSASYSDSSDEVRNVVLKTAAKIPEILNDPPIKAVMVSHGDNAVNYRALVWCRTEDYWNVKFALTEEIKKSFDRENIESPFPQIDVHIKNQKE